MLSNRPVVTANVLKQLWGLQIRSATDNISPKHFKRLKLGEKNTDYFLDSILVNLYKKNYGWYCVFASRWSLKQPGWHWWGFC